MTAFNDQASRYDERADLVMGDRDRQRRYLRDLVQCLPEEPRSFLELACGTGYFTEVLFEVFPGIRGVAVDGSEPMLEQARARFGDAGRDLTLRCELLQSLDWSAVGNPSLVFSAFAVHHLSDDEKRVLLRLVFEHLEPGGSFVLFDSFRPDDPAADAIVERLACMEIRRRVEEARGAAPALERVIARDREVSAAEGDQEASMESHLRWLRDAGFVSVAPVFLDARLGGVVAFKPA